MPRLQTLYRTLGKYEPLQILIDHLSDHCSPPFVPDDPEHKANLFLHELRPHGVEFYRTVIELVTRYAQEFTTWNADLAASAPEYERGSYFLTRAMDQVVVQIKHHLQPMLDPDEAIVEFGIV